jgi:hypothetical protein
MANCGPGGTALTPRAVFTTVFPDRAGHRKASK